MKFSTLALASTFALFVAADEVSLETPFKAWTAQCSLDPTELETNAQACETALGNTDELQCFQTLLDFAGLDAAPSQGADEPFDFLSLVASLELSEVDLASWGLSAVNKLGEDLFVIVQDPVFQRLIPYMDCIGLDIIEWETITTSEELIAAIAKLFVSSPTRRLMDKTCGNEPVSEGYAAPVKAMGAFLGGPVNATLPETCVPCERTVPEGNYPDAAIINALTNELKADEIKNFIGKIALALQSLVQSLVDTFPEKSATACALPTTILFGSEPSEAEQKQEQVLGCVKSLATGKLLKGMLLTGVADNGLPAACGALNTQVCEGPFFPFLAEPPYADGSLAKLAALNLEEELKPLVDLPATVQSVCSTPAPTQAGATSVALGVPVFAASVLAYLRM